MAVLPIYNCFHPVLKNPTGDVAEFDQTLMDLIGDMFETMYAADGIGLAANQVGRDISLFIIDERRDEEEEISGNPIVMINPQIISFSDKLVPYNEGCLSIPLFFEEVIRPEAVQVRYLDKDMKENIMEADGLLARVIQHEFDHLQGVLFTDRLSALKKVLAKKALAKLKSGKYMNKYDMIGPDGSLKPKNYSEDEEA